jgi:hypothetical protein
MQGCCAAAARKQVARASSPGARPTGLQQLIGLETWFTLSGANFS